MLDSFFFATGVCVFIDMYRKYSNRLRKNPDTGIDGSHLHGTLFVNGFARVATAKKKAIGAVIGAVAENHYIIYEISRSGSILFENLHLSLDIILGVKCYQSLTPIQSFIPKFQHPLDKIK
jgi:hypothetical protein